MGEVPIWAALLAIALGPGGALGVALVFVNKKVNGAVGKLDALAGVPVQLEHIDEKLDGVCTQQSHHAERIATLEERTRDV